MHYPGGKGQAGTYQRLINLIPPHDFRIISHLGGGNIHARLRPARGGIAIDRDPEALRRFQQAHPDACRNVSFVCGDAAQILRDFDPAGRGRVFVYTDPPYELTARRSRRPLYRFNYTEADHRELLTTLKAFPGSVLLSGVRSQLYDSQLTTWHRHDFATMTRGGLQSESVWYNYETPEVPHDLRYAGTDYRARERIKRKANRWKARLQSLSPIERAAIMSVLNEIQEDG